MEEEGEDRGGNLYNFKLSLGFQKKLVVQRTNPTSIILTNLCAALHSSSGIRGDNYRPSHTDACLTGPLGDQALIPRNLSPSEEDHTFLEEKWVVNQPPPRNERAKEILPGVPHHHSSAHHQPHPLRMYPPTGQSPLRRERNEKLTQRVGPLENSGEASHPTYLGCGGRN